MILVQAIRVGHLDLESFLDGYRLDLAHEVLSDLRRTSHQHATVGRYGSLLSPDCLREACKIDTLHQIREVKVEWSLAEATLE